MSDAAVTEFPFVQALPKRKQSRIAEVWERIRHMQEVNKQEGGLMPVMVTAKALNISRSRVDDLCREGKLRRFELDGHVYISGRSVAEFAWDERKRTGRPPKIHGGVGLVLDIARGVGAEES